MGHIRLTVAPKGKLVRQKGLEPLAHCLEGSCSIQLSYWRKFDGAGDENRTRIPSLEGWCPDHCATPASALRGNCQLCYITMKRRTCQAGLSHFFIFLWLISCKVPKMPETAEVPPQSRATPTLPSAAPDATVPPRWGRTGGRALPPCRPGPTVRR